MNIITNTILIAILLISTVFGGAIIELRVKTATVHDAGCNCNLEVAILSPNGLCITNPLDSDRDDFEPGHLDSYTGGILGECNGFNAGADVDGWEMVIIHSGSDGWAGEYIEVLMNTGLFVRCELDNQFVDDFNSLHVIC